MNLRTVYCHAVVKNLRINFMRLPDNNKIHRTHYSYCSADIKCYSLLYRPNQYGQRWATECGECPIVKAFNQISRLCWTLRLL